MARLGLGPVFFYEWLRSSRRWQLWASRVLCIAIPFAALCITWVSEIGWNPYNASMRRNAVVGEHIFYAVIGTQLALVLLLAPAATANVICLDKVRGTLVHLLVTDLSNFELVLGKLVARLIPVLGMVACSLPVLFLCLHFGGIDPDALIGAFLVILGVAVLGSTFAMTLSVWGRQTQDVLLANYLTWGALLLAAPSWKALSNLSPALGNMPFGFDYTNPFFLAFAPYIQRRTIPVQDYAVFFAICLNLSLLMVILAAWKIRAVTIRQLSRAPIIRSRRKRWVRQAPPGGSATLDFNPVYWQERRKRPSGKWPRAIWRIYGVVALLFSLAAGFDYWRRNDAGLAAWCNGLQVSIGLLLFGVSLVSAIAEERISGSLEVLLTTPLPTWTIVWGKWLASLRSTTSFLLLPLLVVASVGIGRGAWFNILVFACLALSYAAALISLAWLLATWMRRPGHAIAVLVTLYVSITVGWLMIVMEIIGHSGRTDGLAAASPFYGPGDLTYEMGAGHDLATITTWGIGWTAVYSGMAGFLLMLTTTPAFESRLGRAALRLHLGAMPLQLKATEGVPAHHQRPP